MADNECRVLAEREKLALLSGGVRLSVLPLFTHTRGSKVHPRRLRNDYSLALSSLLPSLQVGRLTCAVTNLRPDTGFPLAIAKNSIIDTLERCERDSFDNWRRDDGDEQQDESDEQEYRQRRRRPQHD